MAHVNGNRYRSFGQGARREKDKAAMSTENEPESEGSNEAKSGEGSIVHVKHNAETGEYHVKDGDGKVTKHASKSDMLEHLDGHFPKDPEEEGDYNESEEEQAEGEGLGSLGKSVKSILG